MTNAVPMLVFLLASTVGGVTQDCHGICIPETIYMPEVPASVISPDWSHPSSLNKWIQKSHHPLTFKSKQPQKLSCIYNDICKMLIGCDRYILSASAPYKLFVPSTKKSTIDMETEKNSSTNSNQENQRMPISKEQKKSNTAKETKKSRDRDPEQPKDSPGGGKKQIVVGFSLTLALVSGLVREHITLTQKHRFSCRQGGA